MNYFEKKVAELFEDVELQHEAIALIYDDAIRANDRNKVARMMQTYPHDVLDLVLGGKPDFIDEEGEL